MRRESRFKHTLHVMRHYAYDLFIPHEGNNHHPHVLHHYALTGYAVLLIGLKVGAIALTLILPSSSVYSSAVTPGNIVSLTNAARSGAGLSMLAWNDVLGVAAQNKANDMALHEYFAHTSPAGVTPWYWIKSAGYTYTYAGENLAVHFSEAEDVTAGWLASPSHRANILEPRFKELGVGVSYGRYHEYATTLVVQMFGVNEAVEDVEVVENVEVVEQVEEELEEPQELEVIEEAEEVTESLPEVQGEETAPVEQVVVTPMKNEYVVEVSVPDAESVALQLAGETVALEQMPNGSWGGSITYDPVMIDENGEDILLIAIDESGDQIAEPISTVAPESEADDVYAFSADDSRKEFLGFLNVKNIDDTVQMIFLFTVVFLGVAVFVTLLMRIERTHHTMLLHVLSIFFLVLILSVL